MDISLIRHISNSLLRRHFVRLILVGGIILLIVALTISQLGLISSDKLSIDFMLFVGEIICLCLILFWGSYFWYTLFTQKKIALFSLYRVRSVDLYVHAFIAVLLILGVLLFVRGIIVFGLYYSLGLSTVASVPVLLGLLVSIFLKMAVLLSIILLLSLCLQPILVFLLGLIVYLVGHSSHYIYTLVSDASTSGFVKFIYSLFYYILPRFDILSYKDYFLSDKLSISLVFVQVLYIILVLTVGAILSSRYPRV